jgi:predicted nuclease of predicted toxin-antitoxin system
VRRILLDQGLALRTAGILRDEGWDAIHVSEIGLEKADDVQILETARQSHRMCVTLDRDFHSHLTLNRSGQPSVVLLRVERLGAESQAILIRSVWQVCEHALAEGAAVSADAAGVRIRRLPLK